MAIDIDLLTFHPPENATDPASAAYGGAANTATEMVTATKNNEFSAVTDSVRRAGGTDYRKQFLYNANSDSVPLMKLWISSNTPATNDTITICQAGTLSMLAATASLGVATYYESATILDFTEDILFSIRPGEWVYSVTYDGGIEQSRQVTQVASRAVTLSASFGSSTTSDDVIGVCPATMFTYGAPTTNADALEIDNLPASMSVGVWKCRTVTAGGPGYTDNAFTLRWDVG